MLAHRGRREAGISLSPLELGVRMLSAISAFCHDELPNTFIPRAWQTIGISRSKVFSDRTLNPKLPPIDHLRPQMKLTSRISDTSILPLTLLDESILHKQEMEYLCDTQMMK